MKKQFKNTTRTCPKCKSDQFEPGAGSGPHVAKLQCAKCKRFMWWLGKDEYKFLANHMQV